MIRVLHRLSPIKVKTAGAGLWADGGNLCLQVSAGADGKSLRRSWIFRYSRNKQEHQLGLGPCHTVSLSEARQQATELRKLLYQGKDPLAVRNTGRASQAIEAARAVTFDQAAKDYIKSHRAGWRSEKHAGQWTTTLATYASPVIGKLPVAAIDTALVAKVLEPIWISRSETASRVRGRIESILDYAKAKGLRSGENPAAWRGNLDHILPNRSKVQRTEHHAAMPYADVPGFIGELRKHDGTATLALEFLILTAARTSEVLGAEWAEIDMTAKLWTVPAPRMKGHQTHRVPLSPAAMAIVERMRSARQNDYLFPGNGRETLSDASMSKLLSRLKQPVTTHGFRASFKTWASDETNFQREVIEKALAHLVGDETERAYDRGNLLAKRSALMNAWASHCGALQQFANTVL